MTNLSCPRPLVRCCHFGVASENYSDIVSDLKKIDQEMVIMFACRRN